MFISDIPSGTRITLSCFAGNKWIKFNLVTDKLQGPNAILSIERAVKGKFLITEPARTQGKVVSFPPGFKYDVSYAIEGKLYVWSNVRVYNFQIDRPSKKILIISSNEQSRRSERRRAYRLPLNIKGEGRFGDGAPLEGVTVKDISSTGIGVVASDKTRTVKSGEVMTISFTDNKRSQQFSIRARIVRIEDAGHGKKVFGGVIIGDRVQKEITNYIQREKKDRGLN